MEQPAPPTVTTAFQRACLTFARIALSAWVGAAALFIVNGTRLVTAGVFGSVERDHIAVIRFPTYYLFGFVLVGAALIALLLVRGYRRKLALGLIVIALVLMLVDYFGVYRSLEAMITPPGQSRTPQFQTYHHASMTLNTIHVGLCLVAAIVINRPRRT